MRLAAQHPPTLPSETALPHPPLNTHILGSSQTLPHSFGHKCSEGTLALCWAASRIPPAAWVTASSQAKAESFLHLLPLPSRSTGLPTIRNKLHTRQTLESLDIPTHLRSLIKIQRMIVWDIPKHFSHTSLNPSPASIPPSLPIPRQLLFFWSDLFAFSRILYKRDHIACNMFVNWFSGY